MGRKILEHILRSLSRVRAYAGGTPSAKKRTHYFSMNPADGKMVRKNVSYPRGKKKKTRRA
jgi:hypothetical protein